jgi:hypothetical protein
MRGQKLREEAAENKRDEHFNTIRLVIPMKQEWRVKDKTSTPTLIAFDHDMDLLDNNDAPLIKDGSPPPFGMDINMVFDCQLSSWETMRRSLSCASVPRRSCPRSPRCRAST